jgi:hypothetical protein
MISIVTTSPFTLYPCSPPGCTISKIAHRRGSRRDCLACFTHKRFDRFTWLLIRFEDFKPAFNSSEIVRLDFYISLQTFTHLHLSFPSHTSSCLLTFTNRLRCLNSSSLGQLISFILEITFILDGLYLCSSTYPFAVTLTFRCSQSSILGQHISWL